MTHELHDVNQQFYDHLWHESRLIDASRFNTWPLVQSLCHPDSKRLEIGPGTRPRLPSQDTCFVDISQPALEKLAHAGGICEQSGINHLPFQNDSFNLVAALDIVEHVENDLGALDELCRVARPGALILLSVPLHPEYWTTFDELVGHYRRYQPAHLQKLLGDRAIYIEQSAAFGMKPGSSSLVDWGMRKMQAKPRVAMWFYNNIFMPLGLLFQKSLTLHSGLMATDQIGEIFLVCRFRPEQ